MRLGKAAFFLLLSGVVLGAGGCMFGPKALEQTHGRYNEAVKEVSEEQFLLNLVRLRYTDDPERLDVSAIAAQYELTSTAEARPFFNSQAARISGSTVYATFTSILPFAGVTAANRPTISLTPLDDPETIRSLFRPSTLEGIVFLSETSWPVSTIFRLWVEYLNGLPNAVTASGPPRAMAPPFREFQRAAELLQVLQDRGDLRFAREEKITDLANPLPACKVTSAAQVEAAKNGFEYRERSDNLWVLVKRDRRLLVKINPAATGSPEVLELCHLLGLKLGMLSYEITVGGSEEVFPLHSHPEGAAVVNLFPRSTVQALYYMAHGVIVPPEHVVCGLVKPTLGPDGSEFDWQQVTAGLFAVYSVKQHGRPKHAWVAVKYRDYWFYVDDRDTDSKTTFTLMMVMARANLLSVRKGGPALTLPVGR